jgi:hypothetical protein
VWEWGLSKAKGLQNSTSAKIPQPAVSGPSQTSHVLYAPEPTIHGVCVLTSFMADQQKQSILSLSIPSEPSGFDKKLNEHHGRWIVRPVWLNRPAALAENQTPLDMGTFEALAIFFLSGC